MSEIEIKFVISLIISLIVHLTDLITVLSLLWMIAIWTPASSLIRRSPAVPHSSEGSATISRAANLIKTLPMKTVIQSQLLADYLCKDPHVCNSSVTHSSDDHHQHILHCVFWNSINGKSLWFFQAILIHMYMQGLKTPMSLMQLDFHFPYIPSKKCPLVVDGSVLQEKLFLIFISILKKYINFETLI